MEIQQKIDEIQSKGLHDRQAIGERMLQSFPAFVLANFPVPDAIFSKLIDSEANHQEFVSYMMDNLLGTNKPTQFIETPIRADELEGKTLRFNYTSKDDVIEISCSLA